MLITPLIREFYHTMETLVLIQNYLKSAIWIKISWFGLYSKEHLINEGLKYVLASFWKHFCPLCTLLLLERTSPATSGALVYNNPSMTQWDNVGQKFEYLILHILLYLCHLFVKNQCKVNDLFPQMLWFKL